MTLNSISNLESLVGLARTNGVDMRPTLLRVLTDLYVQKSSHSLDEERHFTELALRLIDVVDVPTRVAVAERLADYGGAPHAVVLRLARDIPEVAMPVLERTKGLAQSELLTIVNEFGPAHASAVAARPEFGGKGASADTPVHEHPDDPAGATELSELFFAADADERRMILLNLDYAPIAPAAPMHESHAREAARRLETAALAHNVHEVAVILMGTLGIGQTQSTRVAQDPSGEPMIVAAKALNLPADVLQRIILFLNPLVGESVHRVYDLARLYDEITPDAALRMISIWREATTSRPPRYQPAHHDDEWVNARAASTPRARRYRTRIADSSERSDQRRPGRS